MDWTIATFYRFVALSDLAALRSRTAELCRAEAMCGTILLAAEGVNGTLAGESAALRRVVAELDRTLGIGQGELKFSLASAKPFKRLKVRLRDEIITMRAPEADPVSLPGTYVEPRDWNRLISDPDVLLIDTRNAYETKAGTFRGALDPSLGGFSEFKDFVLGHLDPQRHPKVAMYCTGGIRCEKAAAFMRAHGFDEVYHLKGGVLRYLEDVPPEDSLWDGDCYVFDGRVAVGHGLAETEWRACHGCGSPLTPLDRLAPAFEDGVSCPRCIESLTQARAAGLRMRHRQMNRDTDAACAAEA